MFTGGTGEECFIQLKPQGKLLRSVRNYSGWKLARIQAICSAPREKKNNDRGWEFCFFNPNIS